MTKCIRCTGLLNKSYDNELVCMMCGHVTYPPVVPNARRKDRAKTMVISNTQNEDFKREVSEYAIQHHNNYKTAKKYGVSRNSVTNWVRDYKRWLENDSLKPLDKVNPSL